MRNQSLAQEAGLRLHEYRVPNGDGAVERWLHARLNLFVYGVIAAGFLWPGAYAAGRSFLNPDEALHYLIPNQSSALFAYRISLTNAHPPLIYLLLYYWSFLGRSELMLRFPSVLAGTALCWAAYKWIGILFGKAAGVIGLILVAFSPVMIALSAEVRAYALLLFFETPLFGRILRPHCRKVRPQNVVLLHFSTRRFLLITQRFFLF